MKILLIRFSALGDVAMLAAVVREIAQERPDDELTVLSMPFCAPLFDETAPNVHFLGRDVKHDYKGIPGLYKLFVELDSMHFDYVCDMHDVLRTKVLRLFFEAHGYKVSKINKHREYRKKITAQGNKKKLLQAPTSFENYRASLPPYGQPLSPSELSSNSSLARNPSLASNSSLARNPSLASESMKVGIAPFAAHEGKIYPLDKMERVIELLQGKDVYLFGGGGKEKEQMQAWADKYPWVHLASEVVSKPPYSDENGKGGLRAELKLMKDLDVMISMDSANMHLASFVGTRVVSIWGATHPFAGFLGYGQSLDDCVQLDLPCRPCSIYGNKPCIYGDHRCMNIEPETIVKRIQKKSQRN